MDPSSASLIALTLEEEVRANRLPPGTVLHQEALAERFSVSRQPIRMAIEILRSTGIAVARPDRSVEIVGMSESALGELLGIRILLEREALVLALPRLCERDTLEAKQVQERLELEADPK